MSSKRSFRYSSRGGRYAPRWGKKGSRHSLYAASARRRTEPSAGLLEAVEEIAGLARPELSAAQRERVSRIVATQVRPNARTVSPQSTRLVRRAVARSIDDQAETPARPRPIL